MSPLELYKQAITDRLSLTHVIARDDGHSISIKLADEKLRLEGSVSVTFSNPGGHKTIRVAFVNYAGAKTDSITLKDATPDAACGQISVYVAIKETELVQEKNASDENRKALTDLLVGAGFKRDCDSKYMSVFKNESIMLNFSFADSTTFKLGISKNRKKIVDRPIELAGKFDPNGNWKEVLLTCIKKAGEQLLVSK